MDRKDAPKMLTERVFVSGRRVGSGGDGFGNPWYQLKPGLRPGITHVIDIWIIMVSEFRLEDGEVWGTSTHFKPFL